MRESGLYDYNWKTVMTETAQSTKYEKKFRIQDIGISPFEVQANKDHCLSSCHVYNGTQCTT